MVKIRVGIGLTPCTKQTFALSRAHVGNVFGEVGDSLLGFEFVGASRKDLEVCLESAGGGAVGEEDVGEAVGEDTGLDRVVEGKWWRGGIGGVIGRGG